MITVRPGSPAASLVASIMAQRQADQTVSLRSTETRLDDRSARSVSTTGHHPARCACECGQRLSNGWSLLDDDGAEIPCRPAAAPNCHRISSSFISPSLHRLRPRKRSWK